MTENTEWDRCCRRCKRVVDDHILLSVFSQPGFPGPLVRLARAEGRRVQNDLRRNSRPVCKPIGVDSVEFGDTTSTRTFLDEVGPGYNIIVECAHESRFSAIDAESAFRSAIGWPSTRCGTSRSMWIGSSLVRFASGGSSP
jgi:hypothetical protein